MLTDFRNSFTGGFILKQFMNEWKIVHLTWNALLHYLVKPECSTLPPQCTYFSVISFLVKKETVKTVCCERLLYMAWFRGPPATISTQTAFAKSYCNCTIQDGVQDGRRSLPSTLKKHLRSLFPINQSNINRFLKFFYCPISMKICVMSRKLSSSPYSKCIVTLPCEIWMLEIIIAVYTYFSFFFVIKQIGLL